MDQDSKRRHDELLETFRAVDACLACYYAGHQAIYRPLASQLRLLYCDESRKRDNSLLVRCFSGLQLTRIKPIEWIPIADLPARRDFLAHLRIAGKNASGLVVAKMPFTVTTYANGLTVADMDADCAAPALDLPEWLAQEVTIHPGLLTIRSIIIAVANQGGGIHVADDPNRHLRNLRKLRPAHVRSDILFTVAIGRFTQEVGVLYAQLRDRVGYDGDLGHVDFDPEHPTAREMARVNPEITGPPLHQEGLLAVRNTGGVSASNVRLSAARRNPSHRRPRTGPATRTLKARNRAVRPPE